MSTVNSFGSKSTLTVGGTDYEVFRIDTVPGYEKLPFSLKVLLENLLRTEDGANVTKAHIQALGSWQPTAEPDTEIQFTPARVIMQDFTGVPCIVDLATMREAVSALGGDPKKVNPLAPAELVIDHSVIADLFGTETAFEQNVELEYERNGERYQFLRWGQTAFDDFKVVPPGHRHRAPGQHRVPGARHLQPRAGRRRPPRLPRHPRRHRLAHHDGQRPRRARLGRRRHRGRGGHARPARVDAHPARRRLQAHRLHPDGRDGDGCRAHHHAAAAQARRGRQVRGVLRRRRRRGAAGQPRDDRQHEPGVRLDGRHVPDRPGHARLPAHDRPQRGADRPRRGVLQAAEPVARPEHRAGLQRVPRARPRRPSCRRSPGRSARRTASS